MNESAHNIRLLAAFEIRPPTAEARFVFDRDEAERLGDTVAADLAHCVPEARLGHLITGPALLEPGQIISPEHAPWQSMLRMADAEPEPGITSIGAQAGRLAHAPLMPYWTPPRGLLVCLPIVLLAPDKAAHETLSTRFEQALFETGGLRPPAMGTLVEISGLDPVHGQLMTRADLMAMLKVQLAGAGLDPFWPPVEHAVLEPQRTASLALPGGLVADWSVADRGWELDFVPFHAADCNADEYAMWLRALRQTAAMLESHLVRWRAQSRSEDVEIDPQGRWVRCDLGSARPSDRASIVQHPDVGMVAYAAIIGPRRKVYYPLDPAALDELEVELRQCGIEDFEQSSAMNLLAAA